MQPRDWTPTTTAWELIRARLSRLCRLPISILGSKNFRPIPIPHRTHIRKPALEPRPPSNSLLIRWQMPRRRLLQPIRMRLRVPVLSQPAHSKPPPANGILSPKAKPVGR